MKRKHIRSIQLEDQWPLRTPMRSVAAACGSLGIFTDAVLGTKHQSLHLHKKSAIAFLRLLVNGHLLKVVQIPANSGGVHQVKLSTLQGDIAFSVSMTPSNEDYIHTAEIAKNGSLKFWAPTLVYI